MEEEEKWVIIPPPLPPRHTPKKGEEKGEKMGEKKWHNIPPISFHEESKRNKMPEKA